MARTRVIRGAYKARGTASGGLSFALLPRYRSHPAIPNQKQFSDITTMMKVHPAALLMVLVAVVAADPRFRRQIFGEADPKRVPEMMNNVAFVESQGNCVVASEDDAGQVCDRIGKKLRANLPLAIEKGDCPSACNQDEKAAIVYVIKTLRDKYPDIWESVKEHYEATPEQLAKLDKWVESQSTTSTTTTTTTTTEESNDAQK